MVDQETNDILRRVLCREFLLEPNLYRVAGLDDLPRKLATILGCDEAEAASRACATATLDDLTLDQLDLLLAVRDMELLAHTPASIRYQLRGPNVAYNDCIRTALCYAVVGREGQAFSALRAAAAKNDQYARHHFIYGLLLGLSGNRDRACWELNIALKYEPYETGRDRIRLSLDALGTCPSKTASA